MPEDLTSDAASDYAWVPDDAFRRACNWTAFLAAENLPDYTALERKAAADPEWFWNALVRHLDLRFTRPYTQILDLAGGIEWPQWFIGGEGNITLTLLDRHLEAGRGDHDAIAFVGENGEHGTLTYRELSRDVARCASGLAALGLKAGDAVGLYMPMIAEVAVAYLALARLGCIVLPLFSGFGAAAITTRLEDADAVAVVTADGCWRRGREVAMKSIVDEAVASLAHVRHVVVVPRLGMSVPMQNGRDILWADLLARGSDSFPAVVVPAEHPLMIVYTSGTTGRPKGTVHGHYGFAAKTGEDFLLCFDMKPSDRVIWMSDFGWLVGPLLLVSTTLAGATCVLAEGAPDFPDAGRLWRIVEEQKITFLGCGPTLARLMMRHGLQDVTRYDLSSLRIAASTGEPWDADSWLWMFEHVLQRRGPLQNFSGGTEMGGIVATNPLLPMKPASFSGAIPGTGGDIVDETGRSVGVGEVGELVMRQACIGTTRGLWRTPQRYIESYWSRIPGLWVHGDWASRDADGSWYIHGRSDDTIKISGKRTGPAEIEALLLATHKVADAAAVSVPDAVRGAAVVCAVIPTAGQSAGPALAEALSAAVVAGLGSSFRPRAVHFVADLPRTRNMKIMRRVIRAVLLDDVPGDLSALVNPESVDELRRVSEGARG